MLCVHGIGMLTIPLPPPLLLYHLCCLDCGLYSVYRVHCSLFLGWYAALVMHTSLRPLLTLVTCECLNAKHAYFLFLSHLIRVCSISQTKNHRTPSATSAAVTLTDRKRKKSVKRVCSHGRFFFIHSFHHQFCVLCIFFLTCISKTLNVCITIMDFFWFRIINHIASVFFLSFFKLYQTVF